MQPGCGLFSSGPGGHPFELHLITRFNQHRVHAVRGGISIHEQLPVVVGIARVLLGALARGLVNAHNEIAEVGSNSVVVIVTVIGNRERKRIGIGVGLQLDEGCFDEFTRVISVAKGTDVVSNMLSIARVAEYMSLSPVVLVSYKLLYLGLSVGSILTEGCPVRRGFRRAGGAELDH